MLPLAIHIRKKGDDDEPSEDDGEQSADVAPGQADPFIGSSVRTFAWFSDNRRLVSWIAGGAIVLAIGAYVGVQYLQQQRVKASNAVSEPIRLSEVPVEGSPRLKIFEQRDRITGPEETFDSMEAKWSEVYDEASSALDAAGGTAVEPVAHLSHAGAALRREKYSEAISSYQNYLDQTSSESANLPLVHYGLAAAYAGAEEFGKARETLDKMVDADDRFESLVTYQKAILFQHEGDAERAKELFHQVLEQNPQSPYKSDIERRIALLS